METLIHAVGPGQMEINFSRGVLITPFHNMVLVCPATTPAHVQQLLHAFDAALALLFGPIDAPWLKAGSISNQLFDTAEASAVLNDAHADLMRSLDKRDAAALPRAVARDIFVAGQFLRARLKLDS